MYSTNSAIFYYNVWLVRKSLDFSEGRNTNYKALNPTPLYFYKTQVMCHNRSLLNFNVLGFHPSKSHPLTQLFHVYIIK